MAAQRGMDLRKVEELDIGALVVSTATEVVKKRPVSVSLWVFGLLLAAFAKGFAVDETTRESYSMTLEHAREVDQRELSKALRALQHAEDKYYNAKGWFWSCDDKCMKYYDKVQMAKQGADRVQQKRDKILTEAKREVGIWSVFGVQDVRDSFWSAWKSGKDMAARWTMMDAFFMMVGGNSDEKMLSMVLKLVFQYIMNLTLGLIGAFFYFIYNVYVLIGSYGESALSGLAFFLLVMTAGVATVGSYLIAIYGTVAGGGLFLLKQAAKQAAVEGGAGGRPRQQVQYGGGRPGGYRSHMD